MGLLRSGRLPVIAFIAWAIFYTARPFRLGFIADDWSYIVAWSEFRFDELLTNWQPVMPTRPIGRFALSIFTVWFGATAVWWHVALAGFSLLNAALIYEIARRLSPDRDQYIVEADIAAACWLVMPWLISSTAWPILIIAQISVTFLLLSCLSLQVITSRFQAGLLAGLLFALSLLTYEVFHGQFFAVLLIGAFWVQSHTLRPAEWIRAAIWPCVFVGGAQLAVLAYTAWLGISKPLSAAWLPIFINSFTNLPTILLQPRSLYIAAAVLVGFATIGIVVQFTTSHIASAIRSAAALIILVAAIAIGVLVFAIGGYGQIGSGLMSRSSLAIGVWLAFGVFFLADASRRLPFPAQLIAAPLLLFLAFQYHTMQSIWITAYEKYDQTLKGAPVQKLLTIPSGASLIYLGPSAYDGQTFLNDHDLKVGLAVYHRELTTAGKLLASTARTWVLVDNERFHWDGATLTYTLPGYWEFKAPVSKLFIWTAHDNAVAEVKPGWSFDEAQAALE